jgi:hypothetical protein
VRPEYRYAIGFKTTNVGDGPAIHVVVGFVAKEELKDEGKPAVHAEMVDRDLLLPGEPLEDHVGLRGPNQEDDPTDEQAREFFASCVVAAMCWDMRGQPYTFLAGRGGRARIRRWWRPSAPTSIAPHEFLGALYQHPSRGEEPRASGTGPQQSRAFDESE